MTLDVEVSFLRLLKHGDGRSALEGSFGDSLSFRVKLFLKFSGLVDDGNFMESAKNKEV